jgi:putative membrane protein
MKKSILYLFMSALMLIGLSCGSNDGRDDSTEIAEEQNEETFEKNKAEEDAEFAVEAADGSMLEVELGTMALTRAASPEVKQFAQKIIDEHTRSNNELKALAQKKNITLPTTMGDEHKRKYENLQEKTGPDFDKEYMDLMVKDHKDDIREFEEQVEDGSDLEIKEWASSKLPTLRNHLEEAERVHETVKEKDRG